MIDGINTWAVGVVRYSAGIVDWTMEEVANMDRGTRKILAMNSCLHTRSNIARLYLPRKEGGREVIGIEECVRADLHGTIFVACDNGLRQAHDMTYDCCVRQKKCRSSLKHVLKRCDSRKSCRRPVVSLSRATKTVPCKSALRRESTEWMLQAALKEKVIVEGDSLQDYERRRKDEKIKNWKEKALHGAFVKKISNKAGEESWRWLRNGFLKKGNRRFDPCCSGTSFKSKLYQV